jgi:thiamine-phosphate pyrophosphorylase
MDPEVLRILDVNLNRAREALRVIEDYARFVLDDADIALAAKRLRHELRPLVESLGREALLAARDIHGDVGRDAKTAAELRREVFEDVVRAAFGRLSEAARALGEYGKLVAPGAAAAAETLRYAAYELEQRVLLRGTSRARFRSVRLYVLITEKLCRRDWFETAEAAIRGGAGCLQLRETEFADAELLHRARRLRELTAKHQVLLSVNNRPDIARLAAADIIHVGQDDLSVAEVRRAAGSGVLVGKSTHTMVQFEAAAAEQPDYLSVGPIFASQTKPQSHIAGPHTLVEAAARSTLPLVAIGGVTAENAATLIQAGASAVAVCGAVIAANDVEAAAAHLVAKLAAPPPCQAKPAV